MDEAYGGSWVWLLLVKSTEVEAPIDGHHEDENSSCTVSNVRAPCRMTLNYENWHCQTSIIVVLQNTKIKVTFESENLPIRTLSLRAQLNFSKPYNLHSKTTQYQNQCM